MRMDNKCQLHYVMSQTLQTYQYLYGFYLCDDRTSNNEGKFNSNSKHTWLFLYLVIHSVIEAFPLLRFQQYWCNADTAKRSVTSKYSQKVWECLCEFRPVSHRAEIWQLNSKYYLRSQHFFEVVMFFDVWCLLFPSISILSKRHPIMLMGNATLQLWKKIIKEKTQSIHN